MKMGGTGVEEYLEVGSSVVDTEKGQNGKRLQVVVTKVVGGNTSGRNLTGRFDRDFDGCLRSSLEIVLFRGRIVGRD
jgi:hypothetical protein